MNGILFRVGHLIRKELLATLRDPRVRILLIVPPLLQIVLFAFAITQEVNNAALAVVNRDAGIEGAALIKSFGRPPVFRKLVRLQTEKEVSDAIDRGEVLAAIVIPSDFSRRLLNRAETAEIEITLDGRRTNAAGVLGGYLSRMIQEFGEQAQARSAGTADSPESDRTVLSHGVQVVTRRWFNPNLIPRSSFLPGLICVLSAVVAVLLSGLTIARERENGTFDQILVSPLSPLEILIGKAVTVVFLATVSACLVTLVVVFGFGLTLKGPFLLFLSTTVIFLFSVVGIGLFISSLSTTQQQAILGCFLVVPPAIMLSGFATPIENMPAWLQAGTVVNPVRWFLIIVKGLFLRGMSAHAVWLNTVPLILIALAALSAAAFMFKRRMA